MQLKNNIIISAAGSGKTSYIVNDALKNKNKKILITTFTNENLN
ncbi:MAG: UvrD-helicase domain-containing protein, partial [Peptostreptococcaceae bacterium]